MPNPRSPRQAHAPRKAAAHAPQHGAPARPVRWLRALPYALLFAGLWLFFTVIYGDVLARTAQENFVCCEALPMRFLTLRPLGWLYWGLRFGLLPFAYPALGGALLAGALTLAAYLADGLLRLRGRWRGAGALVALAIPAWMVAQGTALYYKSEPSLFVGYTLALLALLGAARAAQHFGFLRKKGNAAQPHYPSRWGHWAGCLVVVAGVTALSATALRYNQNERLLARMQLRLQRGDFEGMIDDALGARRPDRAVAAYYAIALLHEGALVERLFELPFDYPPSRLPHKDGSEEYGQFLADCNFYSGLINPAYRASMDHMVMNGPSVYHLRRIALSALMNGEPALTRKYLALLDAVPGQGGFTSECRALLSDSARVAQAPGLALVKKLRPIERFNEQNYPPPTFLGYHTRMKTGPIEALAPALTALLYSKDLKQALQQIGFYKQLHGGTLPATLQQALAVTATLDPGVEQQFPAEVAAMRPLLSSFLTQASPYVAERKRLVEGKTEAQANEIKQQQNAILREALRDDWLGTYFYYYYAENNDPNVVRQGAGNNAGVN